MKQSLRRYYQSMFSGEMLVAPSLFNHILITVVMTTVFTIVSALLINTPYGKGITLALGMSAALHSVALLFFKQLRPLHVFIMQLVNMFLIVVIMHLSGGIVSPFAPVMLCILMADYSLGLNVKGGLVIMLVLYLTTIGIEYFGILPQHDISASTIYANPIFTVITVLANVMFLAVFISQEKEVMGDLRARAKKEFAEKEEYRGQIVKMDRMYQLGYLTARVAHDVRSPMTVIKGVIQSVQLDFKKTDEIYGIMDTALGEVRRMEGLVNNLSGFVRPGDGKKKLVTINELVDRIICVSKMNGNKKEVVFSTDYQVSGPIEVYACPEEIQQVLFNLIKNAVEAIDEGPASQGAVTVSVRPVEEKVTVSVTDNGCGIAQAKIDDILKDFHTTKATGWGLGMGIVRDILTSHRTKLDIDSKPQQGTTISFHLPTEPFKVDF